MTETIGFDRIMELDWLDLIASRFAETHDPKVAFYDARSVVTSTVAGGASHHNASGKTLTVLARVWLKVPKSAEGLRDEAASVLRSLGPTDRGAIHWGMCELAYPFYLDGAAIVGRALRLQEEVRLAAVRSRLTERWGARGTMPAAAQRLLQTWTRWGVLQSSQDPGIFVPVPVRVVSAPAARLLAEVRVMAEPNGTIDLDDLQVAPDLFPFMLPELRPLLTTSQRLQLNREGGRRLVARVAS